MESSLCCNYIFYIRPTGVLLRNFKVTKIWNIWFTKMWVNRIINGFVGDESRDLSILLTFVEVDNHWLIFSTEYFQFLTTSCLERVVGENYLYLFILRFSMFKNFFQSLSLKSECRFRSPHPQVWCYGTRLASHQAECWLQMPDSIPAQNSGTSSDGKGIPGEGSPNICLCLPEYPWACISDAGNRFRRWFTKPWRRTVTHTWGIGLLL